MSLSFSIDKFKVNVAFDIKSVTIIEAKFLFSPVIDFDLVLLASALACTFGLVISPFTYISKQMTYL